MNSFKTIRWLVLLMTLNFCQERDLSYKRLESDFLVRMDGTWQADDQKTFESWIADQDTIYHGLVYEQAGEEKVIREILKIVRTEDGIYYEASVSGQNEGKPIRFKLIAMTDKKVTFLNPDHDFPKKIEYEFLDANHILATVSDAKRDMGRSFTIKYTRIVN